MAVERCSHFHTEFQQRGTRNVDVAFCGVKGLDTKCYGYSDACPIVEFFSPRNKKAKDITFSEPPDPNPYAIPEGHMLRDIYISKKPKDWPQAA